MYTYQKAIRYLIPMLLTLALTAGFLAPVSEPALAKNDDGELRAHPAVLQMAEQFPNEKINVIVQRKAAEDLPAKALEHLGGKKIRDLPLINGFAMELPGKAVQALARSPGVRWIALDAPLISTSILPGHVRDEFSALSYYGEDGTETWNNSWQEIDESNGPLSGYVQVVSSSSCVSNSCLRLSKYGAYREVNLKGTKSATLSFSYRSYQDRYTNSFVNLQVSTDGGTAWTTLATYPLYSSKWEPITQSFDLTPYRGPNTQIRFQASSYLYGYFFVDDVQVEFTRPGSEILKNTGAERLMNELGLDGQGITVAVVDSGIAEHPDLKGPDASRIIVSSNHTNDTNAIDGFGHGSHVAGIIAGNGNASQGVYQGVAPGVNLINVKVSDNEGYGTVSDLVGGLQWIYENRETYNIRVVNISVNSSVPEPYHTSALDAAVEILWFNGIVVVVSAGNNGTGNGPVTILPPGNDPFVITVGSVDDQGTPEKDDDEVSYFSAYGLTEDYFAKPDLVAPGRNVISLSAGPDSKANKYHPKHKVDNDYFRMSGTSMSAPAVSGAVALLLQDEPYLTPDQVKYRLMATSNTSWAGYDPAKAGAGYLDVYAAVYSEVMENANSGFAVSQSLWTGSDPVAWDSVAWNSVAWNSVAWNSVAWNSVAWNSVAWNSVAWNSSLWDD